VAAQLVFAARNVSARAKRLIVGERVQALLVPTPQGLFLVDPEDLGVGGALIKHGRYGEAEIERINARTSGNSNVLFVGSHVGSLVVPISKRVKSVTAVEANPTTFQLLCSNLRLNQCDNVTPIQVAASDRDGELEFVASKTNSGGAKRMPIIKAHMYFADKPSVITVESAKLDDRIPTDFDLIVMDIEGSEYFALKGMPRMMSRAKYLIVEFLPHHLRNVAGVTVEDFVGLLQPYFDSLTIPSKSLTVQRHQFVLTLEQMYRLDESDEGIIFSKA
jgi:FkbM family methyltransferase